MLRSQTSKANTLEQGGKQDEEAERHHDDDADAHVLHVHASLRPIRPTAFPALLKPGTPGCLMV